MAAIGRLPETLADRCIVISMQRKATLEKCEPLRLLDPTPLRRQAARFVLDHRDAIAAARPQLPDDLNDRAADIWEPLFVLADLAAADWPRKARQAAVELTSKAQETSPLAGLFLGITGVFAINKCGQIFSRNLVEGLNRLPIHIWRPLTKGKDLTERSLAQLLRPYGISPVILTIEDHRSRGYTQDDFREPARRYVTPAQAQSLLDDLAAPPPNSAAAQEKNAEIARLERQLHRLEQAEQRLNKGASHLSSHLKHT
jgi:hypothetical protein